MPILSPEQNINAIINMIDNAEKFVIIVSPYTDLKGWDDLRKSINDASKRFTIKYYVRGGQGKIGLEDLNIEVFEVPDLHAKMFFSEKEAIIGSFHLKSNNDINWAYRLTGNEYKELVSFFESYIRPSSTRVEI